jgi:hypothetical protein
MHGVIPFDLAIPCEVFSYVTAPEIAARRRIGVPRASSLRSIDNGVRHRETTGGISRISFQMDVASLPQSKMMRAIDAIGARVVPALLAGARPVA